MLILKSRQVEIKVLITSDNVKINDEYILLFNREDVIGLIPIFKVKGAKEDKELINLLTKYI